MSNATKQKKINKIKKIVTDYINLLKKDNFPVAAAYIYGSYARGNFHQESDIDVCIISSQMAKNWDKNERYLWYKRREIDTRIEPIGYSPSEFKQNWVSQVAEIKKNNIKIA